MYCRDWVTSHDLWLINVWFGFFLQLRHWKALHVTCKCMFLADGIEWRLSANIFCSFLSIYSSRLGLEAPWTGWTGSSGRGRIWVCREERCKFRSRGCVCFLVARSEGKAEVKEHRMGGDFRFASFFFLMNLSYPTVLSCLQVKAYALEVIQLWVLEAFQRFNCVMLWHD